MTPGLSDRAVLEIDIVDDTDTKRTCVFELREDLEISTASTTNYLIGNRGQYLRESANIIGDLTGADLPSPDRRRGYHVDGGAGVETITIEVTGGDRSMQWGDGSTDPDDETDVSKYDATGCDPDAQRDVLDWIVSQAKTDSASPARLYHSEWADGTHASSAGAFGKPRALALREATFADPVDDPSGFSISIEAIWTAVFPESALDEAQGIVEQLMEDVPE